MQKKNRILIIDFSPQRKSSLKELLEGSGFVVETVFLKDDIEGTISKKKPDLILFRVKNAKDCNDNLHRKFKELMQKTGISMAMFSSIVDLDFYIKCLNTGIMHHIKSPGGRNSIVSRIRSIIEQSDPSSGKGEPLHFEFDYHDRHYNLDLQSRDLLRFIISTMESASQQTSLIQDLLKKKDMNEKSCQEDVIEAYTSLNEEETQLEKELVRALKNNEFRLFYQPVLSLKNNSLTGFESLIRWQHPQRGLVMPDDFIPVAEKSPLIVPLGFWIIDEAARQAGLWQDKFGTGLPLRVNVNLSAKQFVHEELCDSIFEIMDRYGIIPENIGFEITESAFMEDMERSNLMLLKLKAKNHPIYMDDFGTGYSSLSYLHHFPVDILKIDKSFVEWMQIDEQSMLIVKTVIHLAHDLHMSVVAEGVETREHFDMLRDFSCDYGQGYLFSRPVSADHAEGFIQKALKKG